MKRIALICILALTLLGSAFHYFKSTYGTVVYALKDMPSRQVVKTGDIEERLIELKKIPGAAIIKSEEAIGNTLRYGVSRGQILSEYDFACKPYRCVFSARTIPKGKEIELADLKETTDDTKLAFVQQQLIVSAASQIVGKRAKDDIAMGEMLFEDNFQ